MKNRNATSEGYLAFTDRPAVRYEKKESRMTFLTQTTGKIELLLTERGKTPRTLSFSCWLNPTQTSLKHTDRGRNLGACVTTGSTATR